MDYLKAERIGTSKWRVLAIPFGGPFDGKDLDGEFFSPKTDIKAEWFDRRPVLWHHAQDPFLKDATLGTEDDLVKEEDGWWATVWLDRASQYWAQVNALLSAGKVYGSSGALGHGVQKDHHTGEILVWPHIEQTLTPTPANPFARVVPAKAVDHFSAAGIGLLPPDLDSLMADLRPDLATAVDAATRGRLAGDLSALLRRTKTL